MADVAKVKALLGSKLSEEQVRKFRDEDYSHLASNGYCDLESFEAATREDLKELLPGRLALVSVLLKAFAPTVPTSVGHPALSLLQSFWSACRARNPSDVKGYIPVPEWDKLNRVYNIDVPLRKGLCVRKCFKPFIQVALKEFNKQPQVYVHVSGPPGLGKSACLWYVVTMVGAITGNPGVPVDIELGDYDVIVQLVVSGLTKSWVGFFRDGSVGYSRSDYWELAGRCTGKVLHLIDQKYVGDHLGDVMIFASPDEENIKQVDKTGGARIVTKVLPTWKLEVEAFYDLMLRELGCNREQVTQVVDKWGHVPRAVLKMNSPETDERKLGLVIDKVSLRYAGICIGMKYQVELDSIPCRLFEMVPDTETYENFTVRFASDFLAQTYMDRYWDVRREAVVTFAKSSEGLADLASLRGYAYEYGVAKYWSDRETIITADSIGQTPTETIPDYPQQLILEVGKRPIQRYRTLAELRQKKNEGVDLTKYLWIPMKHNHLVDFLTFEPNLMGQSTVSLLGHSILEQKLLETAAFMWEVTSYEELTSYLIVTPTKHGWDSKSLRWTGLKGSTRTVHDSLLSFIGRYVAEYDLPVGPVDEKATVMPPPQVVRHRLADPEAVKHAVTKMLDTAKARSESGKARAKKRKLDLQESGMSESALEVEMEVAYSIYEAQELGLQPLDEDYDEDVEACHHCITSFAHTWS